MIASKFLFGLLPILYLLLVIDYGLLLTRGEAFARRTASGLLVITALTHVLATILRGIVLGRVPVATPTEVLSAVTLFLAWIYLALEWRLGVKSAGFFVMGLALACQFVASTYLPDNPVVSERLEDPRFAVHVTLAIAGYTAFVLAAVFGLLYIMLYTDLKSHRFARFSLELPPLEVLNSMNVWCALLGLLLLTGGIVAGIYHQRYGAALGGETPYGLVFSSAIVWLIFGAGFLARTVLRWGGVRIAILSLIGFPFTFISLFLSINLHSQLQGRV